MIIYKVRIKPVIGRIQSRICHWMNLEFKYIRKTRSQLTDLVWKLIEKKSILEWITSVQKRWPIWLDRKPHLKCAFVLCLIIGEYQNLGGNSRKVIGRVFSLWPPDVRWLIGWLVGWLVSRLLGWSYRRTCFSTMFTPFHFNLLLPFH